MIRMKKGKKTRISGGLCCPHCADSKFPCVIMERQMRRGDRGGKDPRNKGTKD